MKGIKVMSLELFKEGIKKFWIVPLILTIILVLTVPAYTLLQKDVIDENAKIFEQIDTSAGSVNENVQTDLAGAYKELAGATFIYSPYVMLVILILPIVLGVQLFGNSKKTKNRLADFIQEKGLSKDCVYKTNIVTGIVLSIMPILVSTVLLVIIKLFAGMGDYITAKVLVGWACLGLVTSTLFFVFTALMGFITKSKPLQVLYTYGLMFIPVFMAYLFEIVLTRIIYGFPGFTTGIIEFFNQIPAIKVCQSFTSDYINYIATHSLNIWYALVYAVIIAAIVFVGYKLLSVKDQEKLQTVGDKIFKYIWIFIVGSFLYVAFALSFNNALIAILVTVAILLSVYILKELITKKSFKALLNGKVYYIISVVAILFVGLLSNNLFGYEIKVSSADEVEYMTYTASYPNEMGEIEFRTEENIKFLMDKHQSFIAEKNKVLDVNEEYTRVFLQYKLKNGDSIIRSYETVLSMEEEIFASDEYVKQKYAYMFDNSENIDILKIAGYYNDKQFMFEANRYENLDMLNEVVSCIASDLTEFDVHIASSGEYKQFSDREGIQILQVALLDGMNQYTSYLYYLKIDDEYKLVKKLQDLIDDKSEFISWEE